MTHVVSPAADGAGDAERAGVGLTATHPGTEGVEGTAAHSAAHHLKQTTAAASDDENS